MNADYPGERQMKSRRTVGSPAGFRKPGGRGRAPMIVYVAARALPPGVSGMLPDALAARTRTESAEQLELALAARWLPVA
jgi:hypothetical protein